MNKMVNNLKIIEKINGLDLKVEYYIDNSRNYGILYEEDVWKCIMNNTIKEGYIYAFFKVSCDSEQLIYIE